MYTARADGDFGLEEYSEHETLIDAKRAANAMFDDNLHSPRVEDASGSVVYYPWNELRYHKPERAVRQARCKQTLCERSATW